MKTALLVMLHGSPYAASNAPALRVVEDLRRSGRADAVHVGYLECNEPSIPDAVRQCVEAGAQRVIAVPYFLHTGTHVACDLPSLLEEAAQRWPDVEFLLAPYLGAAAELADILARRAREALSD